MLVSYQLWNTGFSNNVRCLQVYNPEMAARPRHAICLQHISRRHNANAQSPAMTLHLNSSFSLIFQQTFFQAHTTDTSPLLWSTIVARHASESVLPSECTVSCNNSRPPWHDRCTGFFISMLTLSTGSAAWLLKRVFQQKIMRFWSFKQQYKSREWCRQVPLYFSSDSRLIYTVRRFNTARRKFS